MKGIVFTLFQDVVTRQRGEDGWDALLERADADGAYTALGNYPSDEFHRLVAAAAADGDAPDAVLTWFGQRAMPLLADSYPAVFAGHTDARAFILTLNEVIHPEVHKLFPGARTPSFRFDTSATDTVTLSWASDRGLCRFAEGLVRGAATHYGQSVTLVHAACIGDGDDRCALTCEFGALLPAAVGEG